MTPVARSKRTWPTLVLVLAGACKKHAPASETAAPEATPPDGAATSPGGPPNLESLERALAERNGELSAATTAQHAAGADPMAGTDETQCERVCDLKVAICTLADAICGLADEHADEARYVESCERARGDCERASEGCDACDQ